jgi:hypothetical protein
MYNYLSDKYIKFFRTIPKKYPVVPYKKDEQLIIGGCHWGQLKLLYSEIELLTIISKHISLKDCLIVYVGAAPSSHNLVLCEMFPDSNWLLIDPAKFDITENKQVKIINDFYTDKSDEQILKIAGDKKIIFISDIRIEVIEKKIWEDMINQQKWAFKLNPEFIMMKFRFPYLSGSDFEYDVSDIRDKIIITNKKTENKNKLYLRGDIFVQIAPKIRSGETRLITSKIKYINDKLKKKYDEKDFDKYMLKYYDSLKYEGNFNYFNTVDRLNKFEYKDSKLLKEYLLGFDDGYDSVGCYHIIYKYFKNYKKTKYDFEEIVKLLFKINKIMTEKIHNSYILCSINTNLHDLLDTRKRKKISQERIDKFVGLLDIVKKSYEEQCQKIKNIVNKESQMKLYDGLFVKYLKYNLIEIKKDKIFINKRTLDGLIKKLKF